MQHTSEELQDHHNGSANDGDEDSTSMTIEYLRARLHSERSVTKATRERADDLAKRVAELEEQLKIVSLQRKKAEKATLDVLALLENHGMGEISDEYEYDSDSGMDESHYEPKLDKGDEGEESSVISKRKEGSSGSENGSTPPIGRSLSWKSSKGSPRSCDRKCFDPSPRRRNGFIQFASSSKHRLGKSCRQIKRREVRSIAEESRHESRSPDVDGSGIVDRPIQANGLDARSEELRQCSENNDEKALLNAQILISSEAKGQVSDASVYTQKHSSDGEMERALQHQAQLIGLYAAEEKAQREWEEKYMGNGYSLPDSCEPGNQSDVTEERDAPEERGNAQALAASPTEIIGSNSNSHKPKEESICRVKGSLVTHVDSFKFSANAATESSSNLKVNEVHSRRASTSEFAFPVVDGTQVLQDNHITNPPPQSSPSQTQCHSPCSHNTVPSFNGGNNYHQAETSSNPRSKEYAIVPHEGPQRLDGILDALQQAKQFLGRNISSLPPKEATSIGIAAETSVSPMWVAERMKMDVGSAGLFRVPTDFQFESSGTQTSIQGSGYPSRLSDYHNHSRVPTDFQFESSSPQTTAPGSGYPSRLNDYRYHSSLPLTGTDRNRLQSTETRLPPSNLDPFFSSMPPSPDPSISSSKPWYDTSLPSSSGFTPYSPSSPYPDRNRWISSSETPYTVQSPSRSPGLPPTGHPFLYNDHVRPGMYRYQ